MQDNSSTAVTTALADTDTPKLRKLTWQAWLSVAYGVLFAMYVATYVLGSGFFPLQIVFGDAGPIVYLLVTLVMPFVGVWGVWRSKNIAAKIFCGMGILLSLLSILLFFFVLFIFLNSPQH